MTDAQLQAKLNKLTKMANDVHDEIQRRYGSNGSLFYEAEGAVFAMKSDCCGSRGDRQDGVVMYNNDYYRIKCGAW